jgi:hypothetical protein
MKVYVITSGSYSDYGIDKVFLDKEKAEKYVELSKDKWDEPRIEIYETDENDNAEIKPIKYVNVGYLKQKRYSWEGQGFKFKICTTNTIDDTEEDVKQTYLWGNGNELHLQRVIKGDYDEGELYLKYEKVCQDLMAKVSSLLNIEGWTVKMVEEWLGQNSDSFIK